MSEEQRRAGLKRRQRVRTQISDAMSRLQRVDAKDKDELFQMLIANGVDDDVPAIKDALGKLGSVGVLEYTHPILLADERERHHILVFKRPYVAP